VIRHIPVFKIRDFRILVMTRWFITIALQVQAVIVGWQVYQIKPDPLLLGLLGLAEAVPAILCSFWAGHIVDNHRPARVYRLSLVALFFNGLLQFLIADAMVPVTKDVRLLLFYFAVFVSGVARSFAGPAVFSLIPQIVSRELIAASSAWNSSAFQLAAIMGPAAGGLIYGMFGASYAFAIIPLFTLFALIGVTRLSPTAKELRSKSQREPFTRSVRTGIEFVYNDKVLLSAMTLDMFSVLFGGAVAVLPIYADQVLHVGASGLGLLRSAPALGSLLILLFLGLRPLKVISGKMLLSVVAGFGATTLLFGISTNFTASLVFLAMSGSFDGVSMVIRSTILQLRTPDHVRGRVSAVSTVFITSSNEIGAFESGFAAKLLGLVPSVAFGGAMTLLIVAATACFAPELRRTRIKE
jgi:MFS family permease